MFLSDVDIRKNVKAGNIIIEPFDEGSLGGSSYDLHLSNKFLFFDYNQNVSIDPRQPTDKMMKKKTIAKNRFLILHPNDMVLGCTIEKVGVNYDFCALLQGKSSVARLSIIVYTAGLLNPGNTLSLTLELTVIGRLSVRVWPGMPIAQIMFSPLSSTAQKKYGVDGKSTYTEIGGPEASQIHKTF